MTSLVRLDPFRDLFDLERDMSRFLSRSFGDLTRRFEPMTSLSMPLPAVDVLTRGDDLVVRAELPGLTDKDVDITLDGRTLIVRGERREEHEERETTYHSREITYGSFERHVPLPEGIDADKIRASLTDGVLEVVVPHAAELTGAKRIPIEVGKRKALISKAKKAA